MDTPAPFHGILRKMINPVRMISTRLGTLGKISQFALQKKTGFLNRFQNKRSFTLQQNKSVKNIEAFSSTNYFRSIHNRYGEDFQRHVLHSNLSRGTSETPWNLMDLALPMVEAPQSPPQQVTQVGNKLRNVQSFSAGQVIPPMEKDVLFNVTNKRPTPRSQAPKKPVITPSSRLFSRVEEVYKDSSSGTESQSHSDQSTSPKPAMRQIEPPLKATPEKRHPMSQIPEVRPTIKPAESSTSGRPVVQREIETKPTPVSAALSEMPLVHPTQPEPVKAEPVRKIVSIPQAEISDHSVKSTDMTKVTSEKTPVGKPVMDSQVVIQSKPSNQQTPPPAIMPVKKMQPVMKGLPTPKPGKPVVQREMIRRTSKAPESPVKPPAVREIPAGGNQDIPRISSKSAPLVVHREIPVQKSTLPVVVPQIRESQTQPTREPTTQATVEPRQPVLGTRVEKPLAEKAVAQRQVETDKPTLPQEKNVPLSVPKMEQTLVKPHSAEVVPQQVETPNVVQRDVGTALFSESESVLAKEKSPEPAALPLTMPMVSKPVEPIRPNPRFRQPMYFRRLTPSMQRKSSMVQKINTAPPPHMKVGAPVVQREPENIQPTESTKTIEANVKQPLTATKPAQEKPVLRLVSHRSKPVPVTMGIVQRMPVSRSEVKLPKEKLVPVQSSSSSKEEFPVVKSQGTRTAPTEEFQRQSVSSAERSAASSQRKPSQRVGFDQGAKGGSVSHPSSPSLEPAQTVSSGLSVVRRELDETATTAAPTAEAEKSRKIDLDKIARQIYPIILRKLSVDKERSSGGRR